MEFFSLHDDLFFTNSHAATTCRFCHIDVTHTEFYHLRASGWGKTSAKSERSSPDYFLVQYLAL